MFCTEFEGTLYSPVGGGRRPQYLCLLSARKGPLRVQRRPNNSNTGQESLTLEQEPIWKVDHLIFILYSERS